MTTQIETETLNILVTGAFSGSDQLDQDLAMEKVIDILSYVAENNSQFLLKSIQDTAETKIDGMIIPALAILTAKADKKFLIENAGTIKTILSIFGPPKLLEYIEFLKCKTFGRGFGSQPQKWIRAIMEGWRIDTIDTYLSKHTKAYYDLLRLVHPRYHGQRGELVKGILQKQ